MTSCLTYIKHILAGLCMICGTSCATTLPAAMTAEAPPSSYRTVLAFRQTVITGMTLVRHDGDVVMGSVINEFGVKIFDFVSTGKRCRLLHGTGPVGHWPVRRWVAQDMAFWLSHTPAPDHAGRITSEDRQRTLSGNAENLRLRNSRTGIAYTFQLIP